MSALWHIQLLGSLAAWRDGREIRRFQTRKTGTLLAYLAYGLHHDHSRDVLIELLWPEADATAGRDNLNQSLYSLRRQFEPPGVAKGTVLLSNHNHARLNSIAVSTDVDDFIETVRQAEQEPHSETRIALLTKAVEIYRGELLPGYYDDWVLIERERLSEKLVRVLSQLVEDLETSGDTDRALEFALTVVQAAPLREEAYQTLMRLYATRGLHGDAINQYQRLSVMLRREEGRRPSPATQTQAAQLAASANIKTLPRLKRMPRRKPSASNASSPLSDEASEVSPVILAKTQPGVDVPPALRLPLKLTRFFGRESELSRLLDYLSPGQGGGGNNNRSSRDRRGSISYPDIAPQEDEGLGYPRSDRSDEEGPEHYFDRALNAFSEEASQTATPSHQRLVTLLGPGGCGKTRLALEAATELAGAYSNAVYFVPLAEVSEGQAIPGAILDTLPVARSVNRDPMEQIVEFLAVRPSLLILDNLEQITDSGADIVWRLLESIPTLTCLVTSRHLLELQGEIEFAVRPLPVPAKPGTPERLLEFASIQMFVDRAQAACPDFQITSRNSAAVAAVCRALEGIPLAIELAAARAQVLTPSQMLKQLADRFEFLVSRNRNVEPRHRTLWAAVEWSYDLLPPDLQHIFRSLSVFRGGWTLEAAQAVCETESETGDPVRQNRAGLKRKSVSRLSGARKETGRTLASLEQLAQRSLIVAEPCEDSMRYRMLETLREFAIESLKEDEEEIICQRHGAYYLRLAEFVGPQLRGGETQTWLERLDREHDNFLAALGWHDGDLAGLRLAGALWRFWFLRGHVTIGRQWLQNALAGTNAAEYMPAGAQCNCGGAWHGQSNDRGVSAACGSSPSSQTSYTYRAKALTGVGALTMLQGDLSVSREFLSESEAVCRRLGDHAGLAETLNVCAVLADKQGNYKEAACCHEETLCLMRTLGDRWGQAMSLNNLGCVVQNLGDISKARACYRESQEIYKELRDWSQSAVVLNNLGSAAFEQGDVAEARVCYEQSLKLFQDMENRFAEAILLHNVGEVLFRQNDASSARPYFLQSLKLRLEMGNQAGLALPIAGLGNVARAVGDLVRAARLFAAAEVIHETHGTPLHPIGQRLFIEDVQAVREAMNANDFAAAWAFGRELPLDRVVVYAQQVEESEPASHQGIAGL